jgi:plasmid stabilization system protein ParE
MAARSREREIRLSAAALETLQQIWLWNAEHYGPDHADGYRRFLEQAIGTLARPETVGRPIAERPTLRYLLIRRRAGGHGHVAVFEATGSQVIVLRVFHTAQDWQARIETDKPTQ